MTDAAEVIDALRLALHDAIRRPMGVVPESAERFVTDDEMFAAEERRIARVTARMKALEIAAAAF